MVTTPALDRWEERVHSPARPELVEAAVERSAPLPSCLLPYFSATRSGRTLAWDAREEVILVLEERPTGNTAVVTCYRPRPGQLILLRRAA